MSRLAALILLLFTLDASPRPEGAAADAAVPAFGGHGLVSRASQEGPAVFRAGFAEVDITLPGRQPLFTDPRERDHHLDIAGTVTQPREAQLAADPGQHHAPGDAGHLTGERIRWQIAVPCSQPSRSRGAFKAGRIGVGAGLKKPFSLAEADPDLLRCVLLSHLP